MAKNVVCLVRHRDGYSYSRLVAYVIVEVIRYAYYLFMAAAALASGGGDFVRM